jgi:hypothetical protein
MASKRCTRWLFVLALLGSGCGKAGRVPVYPTEGRLLIDGQPAANVFVLFYPQNGKEGDPRPSATTDMDGKFRLTTYEAYDGGPAGDYTVTLMYAPVNSPLSRPKGKPPQVPAQFNRAETSPLRAKIEAKSSNTLEPFTAP